MTVWEEDSAMSNIHRKAFELIEKASSGEIKEWERVELKQHLAGCQQCRADASLFHKLREADREDSSDWQPGDQKLVVDLQQQLPNRRRKHNILHFANGFAWAGLAILFVLGLNWTFSNLIPPGEYPGAVPGMADPELSAPQPGSPFRWIGWMEKGFPEGSEYISIAAILGLIALVGVLFSFYRQHKWAVYGWLVFLLVMLPVSLFLHIEMIFDPEITLRELSRIPPVGLLSSLPVLMAGSIIHLVKNQEHMDERLLLFLLPYTCVLIFYSSGLLTGDIGFIDSSLILWMLIIFGIVLAVFWFGWELSGRWRWPLHLFLLYMYVSVLIFLIMPNIQPTYLAFMSYLPPILPYLSFIIFSFLFWPFAVIVAARLLQLLLSQAKSLKLWHKVMALAGVGATFILAYIALFAQTINPALGMAMGFREELLFFTFSGGALAVIGLSWELPGWRKIIIIVLVTAFVAGLIPAAIIPLHSADQIHLERAERINQVIMSYYDQNDRYPEELNDLIPRYLWYIPRPVTYGPNRWCYEAGEGYYRLGYADKFTPDPSLPFTVVQLAGNKAPPDHRWNCQAEAVASPQW